MFAVYLGDKLLGTFSPQKEDIFLAHCEKNNLVYKRKGEGGYVLWPPLSGVTIALCCWPDKERTSIEHEAKGLADSLSLQGAQTISASFAGESRKFMEVMTAGSLLVMAEQNKGGEKGRVRFYSSLRQKENSLKLITAFIRNLSGQKHAFCCEIPGFFISLLNILRCRKIFFSRVPAVLLECHNISETDKEILKGAICQGLVQVYGKWPDPEKLAAIIELLELLKKEEKPEEQEGAVLQTRTAAESKFTDFPLSPALDKQAEAETKAESRGPSDTAVPKRAEPEEAKAAKNTPSKSRTRKCSSLHPPPDAPAYQFAVPRPDGAFCPSLPWLLPEDKSIPAKLSVSARDEFPPKVWDIEQTQGIPVFVPEGWDAYQPLSIEIANALKGLENTL